jgi:hypothetical protein
VDATVDDQRHAPVLRRIRYSHQGEQRERCFAIVNGEPEPVTCRQLPGLGDVVAGATTAAGVTPCGGCLRRKQAMNRLTPGWVKQMLHLVSRAISRFWRNDPQG